MNVSKWKFFSVRCVLVLVTAMALAGCEWNSDPDTEGVDDYFDSNPYDTEGRGGSSTRDLTITPGAASVSYVGQKVSFRAQGGEKPYTWTVSNNAKGTVAASGSEQGVYTVIEVSPNDVIVTDAKHATAIALVSGPESPLVVTANPETIPAGSSISILTASGGVPPYNWTVSDTARGDVLSSTGSSVTYTRNPGTTGSNAITVRDSAGNTVSIIIKQE
ncbi:MAG TPA: hypothetical protein PLE77_07490 [Kiritimatiellia bacterium]|nr:hypothetical protein [Kiritimatiellia bacterium]